MGLRRYICRHMFQQLYALDTDGFFSKAAEYDMGCWRAKVSYISLQNRLVVSHNHFCCTFVRSPSFIANRLKTITMSSFSNPTVVSTENGSEMSTRRRSQRLLQSSQTEPVENSNILPSGNEPSSSIQVSNFHRVPVHLVR